MWVQVPPSVPLTMKMYVDIDETICKTPENRDYSKSTPISKINTTK